MAGDRDRSRRKRSRSRSRERSRQRRRDRASPSESSQRERADVDEAPNATDVPGPPPPKVAHVPEDAAVKSSALAAMISARLKASKPLTDEDAQQQADERAIAAAKAAGEVSAAASVKRRARALDFQRRLANNGGDSAASNLYNNGDNDDDGDDGDDEEDNDDDLLAEFEDEEEEEALQLRAAEAGPKVTTLKETAADLRRKRLQQRPGAKPSAMAHAAGMMSGSSGAGSSNDPLDGFLASFGGASSSNGDDDPLDSFLSSLEEPVVKTEESSSSASDVKMEDAPAVAKKEEEEEKPAVDAYGTNTITMEEIMAGGAPDGGWESSDGDSDAEGAAPSRDTELSAEQSARVQQVLDVVEEEDADLSADAKEAIAERKTARLELGRCFASDGDVMEERERKKAQQSALELFAAELKKKELKPVDHETTEYVKIRKNFYVVPKKLASLSEEEVKERREVDEIKVRGVGCPPPVESWLQCGLPDKVHSTLMRVYGDDSAPFAVQKQCVPALMSGRDVIGIAKTGSGKTLAFVLPMLRHIMDQPPLEESDGPMAMIMAPARELAVQIYKEARRFGAALGIRCVAVYGGAKVAEQIGELKRGSEVVVCTPGRMIDILTMQQGRLIGLSRLSYVVLDEADRMFDMGFEPQITMILRNARPDRQTALFSATFPRQVEGLARKALKYPLEVVCGGRSVAAQNVTQFVEVREESTKFMRLLQLLGVWYEQGSVLIFVDTQAKCDSIYSDLMKAGYPSLSMHGGMDQTDRETTIQDFQNSIATVMVATSVAGRGLDVSSIVCVINYSAPNHLEDYVHRVGRTGRAGRTGTAYTFISPSDEEAFSPLLVKALTQGKQKVPDELRDLSRAFISKTETGEKKWATSGFVGNRGYKFDAEEMTEDQRAEVNQRKLLEVELGIREPDEFAKVEEQEEEKPAPLEEKAVITTPDAVASSGFTAGVKPAGRVSAVQAALQAAAKASQPSEATKALAALPSGMTPLEKAKQLASRFGKPGATGAGPSPLSQFFGGAVPNLNTGVTAGMTPQQAALARARVLAQTLGTASQDRTTSSTGGVLNPDHCVTELDINDYPSEARFNAVKRDNLLRVQEETGAAIIQRGAYCAPGKLPEPGEKRLYLTIEGPSELCIKQAKAEMVRILNEETMTNALGRGRGGLSNLGQWGQI